LGKCGVQIPCNHEADEKLLRRKEKTGRRRSAHSRCGLEARMQRSAFQITGDDVKKGFIFLEFSKDETPRHFPYAAREQAG
jgi:hypothetical protein